MARVRAHEEERCWACRGPCKPAEMALGVACGIKQVERSIAEEIEGVEAADLQRIGREADFSHCSTSDVAIKHGSVRVCWPPGPRQLAHTWTNDKFGAGREGRGIVCVVEVVV